MPGGGGLKDEYNKIIGIISTIDIREEPAEDKPKKVQVPDGGEDSIDGTHKEKEDSHEASPRLG